jgi:hypothetical protein
MERTLAWMRQNPTLSALTFFLLVTVFLGVLFSVLIRRSGGSLRPLLFFFGFLALVGGPQGVVHLLDALATGQSFAPPKAPGLGQTPAPSDLKPVPWKKIFGPDADPVLITDARHSLGSVLGRATEAKLSFSASGESALAARFSTVPETAVARDAYGTFFAFADAQGSDRAGWTARRHGGQGEWVHLVTAGNELYAWTGPSEKAVLARRTAALGPPPLVAAEQTEVPATSTGSASKRLTAQTGLMVTFLVINLLAATLWFFKASAWSARTDARPTAAPVSAAALRQSLLALPTDEIPIQITPLSDGHSLDIQWRYGDARWIDFMRLHDRRRAYRLVLRLDEAAHTVRVSEFVSAFDASAGPDGAQLSWKRAAGMTFFAVERVVTLDGEGGYTFDLQRLRAPFIEAVTRAGWNWQPVVWDTPPSLRWLTDG